MSKTYPFLTLIRNKTFDRITTIDIEYHNLLHISHLFLQYLGVHLLPDHHTSLLLQQFVPRWHSNPE